MLDTSEKKNYINKLFNERAKDDWNTQTLAHYLHNNIQDTLSGDKYLNELLQNADDAGSDTVNFILSDNYLLFVHNGKHFNEIDVKAISDAANDQRLKLKDSNQIGNKGVGFKAVFTMASAVYIFSDGYQFRFDENYQTWGNNSKAFPWEIIPIWTDLNDVSDEVQENFKFHENNVIFAFILREEIKSEIVSHLNNLKLHHLLFLRSIKKLEIQNSKQDSKILSLGEKQKIFHEENDNFVIEMQPLNNDKKLLIYTKTCNFSQQLVQQLKISKSIPEKYQNQTSITISLALLIKEGKLIPLNNDVMVFCFFPTKINLGTKFMVQAEFMLDTSRMGFREDAIATSWNQFICQSVFVEQFHFFERLATNSEYWPYIFAVLSSPDNDQLKKYHQFKHNFQAQFLQNIKQFPLVVNMNETMITIPETQIALSTFVTQFGNAELKKQCAHSKIAEHKILNTLGAKYFNRYSIIQTMKQTWFLEKIKEPRINEEFIMFLNSYYNQSLDNEQKIEFLKLLQEIAFLLTSNNKLKKATDVYFPEENLKYWIGDLEIFDIIHSVLNAPNKIDILKQIGVNNITFPKIISLVNDMPNELVSFTQRLIECDKSKNFAESTITAMKILKLKLKNDKFATAKDCYFSDCYNPKVKLEEITDSNSYLITGEYISEKLSAEDVKKFFIKLGVQETLTLDKIKKIIEISTFNNVQKLMNLTKYLFNTFWYKQDQKTAETFRNTITTFCVFTKNGKIKKATECYFSDIYNPVEPLESTVNSLSYISEDYIDNKENQKLISAWKEFFSHFGSKQKLNVTVLTNHKDVLRNELVKDNTMAQSYFNYLEKNYTDLYPSETRYYMYQHSIDCYVDIELATDILTTELFWNKISQLNYETFETLKDLKYHTQRSNKRVKSNIHYLVELVVMACYDEEKQPSDLYGCYLYKQLGDYVKHFLIAPFTKTLNEKQTLILGFKSLTLEDIIKLLNDIADADNAEEDFDKILYLYRQLDKFINYEAGIELKEKILKVKLLNQENNFAPATELYYLDCDQLELEDPQGNLIRKPETYPIESFRKLCSFFSIKIITQKELIIVPEGEANYTLSQLINDKIRYLCHLEVYKKDIQKNNLKKHALKKVFSNIKEKFNQINCSSVCSLEVTYNAVIKKNITLWLDEDNNRLYHADLHDLDSEDEKRLYKYLYKILNLTIDKKTFSFIFMTKNDKLEKKYKNKLSDIDLERLSEEGDTVISLNNSEKELTQLNTFKSESIKRKLDKENITESENIIVIESPTKKINMVSSNFKSSQYIQYSSSSSFANSGHSSSRFFISSLTKSEREHIGKEAEQTVYDYLKKKYEDKYKAENICENTEGFDIKASGIHKAIKWLNKNGESYKQHDFEIITTKNEKTKTRYIEVKNAPKNTNEIELNFSVGEWEKMQSTENNINESYRLMVVTDTVTSIKLLKEINEQKAIVKDYKRVTLSLN